MYCWPLGPVWAARSPIHFNVLKSTGPRNFSSISCSNRSISLYVVCSSDEQILQWAILAHATQSSQSFLLTAAGRRSRSEVIFSLILRARSPYLLFGII